MILRSIAFESNEHGDASPSMVDVTMTIEEAALIAKWLGDRRHDGDPLIPNGHAVGSGAYSCLVGDVFNRYWDAGLNGYIRGDAE